MHMQTEKLTLAQLSGYLAYGLKISARTRYDKEEHVGRMSELTFKSNHSDWVQVFFDDVYTFVNTNTYEESGSNAHHFFFSQDVIKPLVIPLDRLTEAQWIEVFKAGDLTGFKDLSVIVRDTIVEFSSTDIPNQKLIRIYFNAQMSFDGIGKFNQLFAFAKLHELHADLHGLIEKGLALNKLDYEL